MYDRMDVAERHLTQIVEELTDGKYTTIPSANEYNECDTLKVRRLPFWGKWLPIEPFAGWQLKLTCKLRLGTAEYVASKGETLPIDVLDERYRGLAERIESKVIRHRTDLNEPVKDYLGTGLYLAVDKDFRCVVKTAPTIVELRDTCKEDGIQNWVAIKAPKGPYEGKIY